MQRATKAILAIALLLAAGIPAGWFLLREDAPAGPGGADGDGTGGSLAPEPLLPLNVREITDFLWKGPDATQLGIAPGAIDETRLAVLRGHVASRGGAPLAGVNVSVVHHPEYGMTTTRADGNFSLVVTGGDRFLLRYEKRGFLPAQREAAAGPLAFAWAEDAVLVPLDAEVTTVRFDQPLTVARGSRVEDADGGRQATLLFEQGTRARAVLANGSTRDLPAVSVRATEYTVGVDGPAAMPGLLPASSGYTYAVELSIDEALGAASVEFSKPVVHYTENFLGFPTGMAVPVGWYDADAGAWKPAKNGRVIAVLSVDAGRAVLDVTGGGAPATAKELASLGIDADELERLAGLYAPGASLWRVRVDHFTPWDHNWPYGPPDNATAPDVPPPGPPRCKPCEEEGRSVLEIQTQVATEAVSIPGTPFYLVYRSDRVPGRTAERALRIPLVGEDPPGSLKAVALEVFVAGQRHTQRFEARANLDTTFQWDGRDAWGHELGGVWPVKVRVGWVYDAVYLEPAGLDEAFGQFGGALTGVRARNEVTIWREWTSEVGAHDARQQGLGGWSIDAAHAYDPAAGVLHPGGAPSYATSPLPVPSRVLAGDHRSGGNLGPATSAYISTVSSLAVLPDGSFIVGDGVGDTLRVVRPDGTIHPFASDVLEAEDLAVGPDGAIYVAESGYGRILRVTPDGTVRVFLNESSVTKPTGIAFGPDGSLYVADYEARRIRRFAPNGTATIVAGNGLSGDTGDGGPALSARLFAPRDVAVTADGTVYIVDSIMSRVRRVRTDGIIEAVRGLGLSGPRDIVALGDGSLVVSDEVGHVDRLLPNGTATRLVADIGSAWSLATDVSGGVLVGDFETDRVLRVGLDGRVTPVAGDDDNLDFTTREALFLPRGLATAPDGGVLVADGGNGRIRLVNRSGPGQTLATGLVIAQDVVAGADGSLFASDSSGSRIWRYFANGTRVLYAGNGAFAYSGDGGPASAAALAHPYGLAMGPDGTLYIADSANDRLRAIGPDGLIRTIAGPPALEDPEDVALAADGTFYVAGAGADRVWRVTPAGAVEVVAGTGRAGWWGDGGRAVDAGLSAPEGVAVGADGSIYIADTGNDRVRRVAPDGTIHTLLGHGRGGVELDGPVAVGIASDGDLVVLEQNGRLRTFATRVPGFAGALGVVVDRAGTELYAFDGEGRHVRTVSALTGSPRETLSWEPHGLAAIEDGYGQRTLVERNATGAPTAIVAPNGERTLLKVGAGGWLAEITEPGGAASRATYRPGGLLASFTSRTGRVSSFEYAADGRLSRELDGEGGSVLLRRAELPRGFEMQAVTAADRATTYRVEWTDEEAVRLEYRFPDGTRAIAVNRSDGRRTTTYPDGTVIETWEAPDPRFGWRAPYVAAATARTPGGVLTAFATVRSASTADPADVLAFSSLTERATVDGEVWTRTYHAANRTMIESSPEGRTTRTTLDAHGATTRIDQDGRAAVAIEHDAAGRVTRHAEGDAARAFDYDATGRLVAVRDPIGAETRFEHDAAGRPVTVHLPLGRTLRIAYDAAGRPVSVTPPGAAAPVPHPRAAPTLDADGLAKRVVPAGGAAVEVDWDAGGRLLAVRDGGREVRLDWAAGAPDPRRLSVDGVHVAARYDGPLTVERAWSGAVEGRVTVEWGPGFRRAALAVDGGARIGYAYDGDGLPTQAGQLAMRRAGPHGLPDATRLAAVTTTTTYDDRGNLVSEEARAGPVVVWKATYEYDVLSRVVTATETADGSTTRWSYQYDLARRLVGATRDGSPYASWTYGPDGKRVERGGTSATLRHTAFGELLGARLADGREVSYLLDASGRRVAKQVDGAAVATYLYEDQRRLVAVLAPNGEVDAQFVYGSRDNVPDYVLKDGRAYRLLTDSRGSVRLVVEAETGAVVQRLAYDPWGRVLEDTNPGFQPLGFAGGLLDRDTGLVHFGVRDYDPAAGRWTADDPLGFAGGDMDLRGYVANDPVNFVDPWGLGGKDAKTSYYGSGARGDDSGSRIHVSKTGRVGGADFTAKGDVGTDHRGNFDWRGGLSLQQRLGDGKLKVDVLTEGNLCDERIKGVVKGSAEYTTGWEPKKGSEDREDKWLELKLRGEFETSYSGKGDWKTEVTVGKNKLNVGVGVKGTFDGHTEGYGVVNVPF